MGVSKKRDIPTMDGCIMENPIRMDDLGGKPSVDLDENPLRLDALLW